MRQKLFWIHADSFFSFAPIEGVAAVGFVVPIALWIAYALIFGWWQQRSEGRKVEWRGPITTAAVGAAVLSAVPLIFGRSITPGIPVFGYGMMVFLGFITGGWLASVRAKSVGLSPDIIWDLLIWFFVAGIGGARLFFLVQYGDAVYGGAETLPQKIFATFNLSGGGLVLFGGVIAVVATLLIFCAVRKVSPLLVGDVIVPSFFVGLMFGRLGCLLNGCCYGNACDLPWAIQFPAGSVTYEALAYRGYIEAGATATYPLHPTQIYSSINAGLLAWVTSTLFAMSLPRGLVLAASMVVYPVTRFFLEILRGDEPTQLGTGLTISQLVSFGVSGAGIALAAFVLIRQFRSARNEPSSPAAAVTA